MTFHLLGLTTLLGSMIIQSLRLFGVLLTDEPSARLARSSLQPWSSIGMILTFGSGFLIFTGGAVNYFEGDIFRIKMQLLMLAIAIHFTLFQKMMRAGAGTYSGATNRITGGVSLALRFSVGVAGRAIGFFG
jgi:hypothetical protein